jgi:hypothetical protein
MAEEPDDDAVLPNRTLWRAGAPVPMGDGGGSGGPESSGGRGGRAWVRPVSIASAAVFAAMLGTGSWLISGPGGDRSTQVNRAPAGVGSTPTAVAMPTAMITPTAFVSPTAISSPTATASDTGTATPPTAGSPTTPDLVLPARPNSTVLPGPPPPPTMAAVVTVPDVTGLAAAEAQQRLSAVGLTYRVTNTIMPIVASGTVIFTVPPPGSPVAAGTRIVVTVAVPAQRAPGS